MKKILIVTVGVFLGILLFAVGCSVLVGGAASEVSKEMDKSQNANSITTKEFRSLELGTPIKEVRSEFGKPADVQKFQSDGYSDTTLYYNLKGGDVLEQFQLTFENGKLTSKSKW